MKMADEKFFSKRFFQNLLIASIVSFVSLALAIFVSFYIGGQIERLTQLSESVNRNMENIVRLVEMGPEGIQEVGTAVEENAAKIGDSIGEGGASVVDKVGSAVKKFTVDLNDVEVKDVSE